LLRQCINENLTLAGLSFEAADEKMFAWLKRVRLLDFEEFKLRIIIDYTGALFSDFKWDHSRPRLGIAGKSVLFQHLKVF
jgi:hypothetical protein